MGIACGLHEPGLVVQDLQNVNRGGFRKSAIPLGTAHGSVFRPEKVTRRQYSGKIVIV